ncbi:tetratricopeptide repeat protein [Hyalangium gracile]|uniref:tetratricopeptide repeat protein n=1 Tax=Hyalangium gracile TaxID=394092 RepID=UPI001CCAD371|nr:tetratricopeptide repeat protein [Hyalangium gracile]
MKKLGRMGLVLGVLTLTGTVACEGKPDPAKEHRIKATNHLAKKEFKLAAAEYELALQANPQDAKSWKEKAFVHQQIGEHDKAGEAMLKYVEFEKDPAQKTELYRVAADEFRQAGKVEDAEKALLQVMATKQKDEEKAELYRVIADQYRQSGNLDAAEQRFNEALKLNPKDEASLGWLAAIYSKRGGTENAQATAVPEHLDKAISYLDQVIALNPEYPFTYINKRIVMAKYVQHEQQQQISAEAEARTSKNKAKSAEAMARAAEHLKRAQEFQKQFEELTAKFKELQPKYKEKQAAAAAAAAAAKAAETASAPAK